MLFFEDYEMLSGIANKLKPLFDRNARMRSRARKLRRAFLKDPALLDLASKAQNFLQSFGDQNIPILVICYNNGIYVENMANQLRQLNQNPLIIDNNSDDASTLQTLGRLEQNGVATVIYSTKNFGHMVGFQDPIYNVLPDVFAYTDPDLQFNPNMPPGFLDTLSDLTAQFSVYKAGLALQLPEGLETIDASFVRRWTYPFEGRRTYSIRSHEERFWRFKLEHATLDLWHAEIDTTFAVYNKKHFHGKFLEAIRIGGLYGCIHLPWFPQLDLFSPEQKKTYLKGNLSTTCVK